MLARERRTTQFLRRTSVQDQIRKGCVLLYGSRQLSMHGLRKYALQEDSCGRRLYHGVEREAFTDRSARTTPTFQRFNLAVEEVVLTSSAARNDSVLEIPPDINGIENTTEHDVSARKWSAKAASHLSTFDLPDSSPPTGSGKTLDVQSPLSSGEKASFNPVVDTPSGCIYRISRGHILGFVAKAPQTRARSEHRANATDPVTDSCL